MRYNTRLVQGLEDLKERFRLDIDEHENYNLIQDTIHEMEYIEDEIAENEKDFLHDIDIIESTYQDEVEGLEDTIDKLMKEIEKLEEDLNNA